KVDGAPSAALPLGDSDALKPGSPIIMVGNPFGLSSSVTWGVVGGRGRVVAGLSDSPDLIQVDAHLNPGDSGGPVIDPRGEAVGILAGCLGDARDDVAGGGGPHPQGIALAVPINAVKAVLPALREGRETERAWLGMGIQNLTPELRAEFGVPEGRGVLVARIVEGGPAAAAGLREGDVVLSCDGTAVNGPRDLVSFLAGRRPGETAAFSIVRDGKEQEAKVTLGTRAAPGGAPAAERAGLILGQTPRRVAERLGPGGPAGLFVEGIVPGSPAARAGLRRGDVILEVNRRGLAGIDEWDAAAGAAAGRCLVRTQRGFFVIRIDE
ncbi:MAG: PDZ domain-containing protein, partial [bacterium]|nr:PDZ domain-containing protein [bacterium]